jgi:hypothetical protein
MSSNPLKSLSERISLSSFLQIDRISSGTSIPRTPLNATEPAELVLVLAAITLCKREKSAQYYMVESTPYIEFAKLDPHSLALTHFFLEGQRAIAYALLRATQDTNEKTIAALADAMQLGRLCTVFRQELFAPLLDPLRFHCVFNAHKYKILTFLWSSKN